tara:strand:- start:170 stop:1618 length:1449 start_codon:yes stop_codon:yes gene_type:complete
MAYTTINKSTAHFNTKLYTGNGGSNSITGIGFQPDFVWSKCRDDSHNHQLFDSVRGATNRLRSDTNGVETTHAESLKTFDSDGFTMGTQTNVNQNSATYVSWNWLAGGTAPTKTYKVVVVSDSGNKFRFRDTADTTTFGSSAVTLDLQEGGTYTFDGSDSTNSSHPFVLGTSSGVDGSYSTGVTYKLDGVTKTYSQYTSGYSSATSRQLIITVASGAPTLYYNCSVHSGMGGQINTNTTFGSSNFDGNLQSLVSANSTAGISIVRYTGNGSASATLGHGLGGVLNQIWQKDLTATDSWHCNTNAPGTDLGMSSGYGLYFNNDNTAQNPADGSMDNFTATTFGFNANGGNVNAVNENNIPCIAYCFRSVPGFSSFGYYLGNGDVNGPFINTGFKPAFVMTKRHNGTSDWLICDNKRPGYNVINKKLFPNTSGTEDSYDSFDFVSNGFKIRSSGSGHNADGAKFVYMAFGQTCVGSNNIPATAS